MSSVTTILFDLFEIVLKIVKTFFFHKRKTEKIKKLSKTNQIPRIA